MFPHTVPKIKFCRIDMSDHAKKIFEQTLSSAVKKLPTDKWKVELSKRISDGMEKANKGTDGPWHCAVGTRFSLNTTNKGNGFGHVMIGPYIHLVVWQTDEKTCICENEPENEPPEA